MYRSYLFAPGHDAKLLAKVFDAGADAVMLDLEDAVPPTPSTSRARWSPTRWPSGRAGSGSTPW
jgi:citrate lyase beta subunit